MRLGATAAGLGSFVLLGVEHILKPGGTTCSSCWRCCCRAAALPVLAVLRGAGWERRMLWGSSAGIMGVGPALFVEQAFL